jgi:hypothetical protein
MKFDKNTIIGFSLMLIMLIGFSWYQTDIQRDQAIAEQARLDSLAKAEILNPKPAEVAPTMCRPLKPNCQTRQIRQLWPLQLETSTVCS